MKQILKKIKHINNAVNRVFLLEKQVESIRQQLHTEIETQKILSAQSIIKLNNSLSKVNKLSELEFKVFSQWGDDGIIQYLIHQLNIRTKTFIEFGVENYTESNTRFLLMNNNWKGIVIDGSPDNIQYIKNDNITWKHSLTALQKFITPENINPIFSEQGFSGEIGLLSIDIDGNDYYVWNAINTVSPIIVICEYNSLFGAKAPYTIPYESSFVRAQQGFAKLFYGASITSLCDLAENKGYSFIGCNSAGNNAYFIRNDRLKESGFLKLSPEEGFIESNFREVYINGIWQGVENNKKHFSDFDVYNTRTKQIQKFGTL